LDVFGALGYSVLEVAEFTRTNLTLAPIKFKSNITLTGVIATQRSILRALVTDLTEVKVRGATEAPFAAGFAALLCRALA